jgi:hypothetical protein
MEIPPFAHNSAGENSFSKNQTSAFLSEFHGVVTDREVLHDRANMNDGL